MISTRSRLHYRGIHITRQICTGAALTIAASFNVAYAQTENVLALDEVVVTAQKREQNSLDVPITVDTFSPQDLADTGALRSGDIDVYIPGFEAGDSPTQNGLSIRGVSSSNISSGGDPSVAVFYDGSYLPLPASNITFMDMAQIEVMKGPQGTLFGRNAAAGVLNLIPNQPSAEDEASISARFGSDSLMRFEGVFNKALTENLYFRAALFHNEKDGFVDNVAGPSDPGEEDNQAARLSMLWDYSDSTSFQLTYDWDQVDNAPRMSAGVSPFSLTQDPTSSTLANDVIDGGEETRDMDAWTFKLAHKFDDRLSMKLTSSYRDYETTNIEEEDGTADPTVYVDINTSYDSDIFYNELQVLFEADNYTITGGISFSNESVGQLITTTATGDSITRLVTAGVVGDVTEQAVLGQAALACGCGPGDPAFAPTVDAVRGPTEAFMAAQFDGVEHLWQPEQMAQTLNIINSLLGPTFPGSGPGGFVVLPSDISATGDLYYDSLSGGFGVPEIFGPSYALATLGTPWRESIINTGDFTNWGIYLDADIDLGDRWSLILGARYSEDDKDYTWLVPTVDFPRAGVSNQIFNANSNHPAIGTVVTGSDDWSKVTGRAVLSYQLSDTAMTFFSLSTGYKSGGFDSLDQRTAATPFGPEETLNYEWGIKGDFLQSRLRTQLSLYRLELDDRQRSVSTRPPGQNFAIPEIISGDQTFDGIEVTVDWLVAENVKLGMVTTYRDDESVFEDFYNANGTLVSDKQTSTSDTAYTLTFDWTPQIPVGRLLVHADYIFQEVSLEGDPNYLPEYELINGFNDDRKFLNARVAWESNDSRYEVALWGHNLLDNQYVGIPGGLSKESFGTVHAGTNAPVSVGMDFALRF